MSRVKIAVIHPRFAIGGGSEAKPLWMLETFKNDFDISLITMGEVDIVRLNDCYGTNVSQNEIGIISIPIPYLFKKRFDVFRNNRLARFCKKKASEFDLMISTYNTMDFGKKGIQCIADFSFDDELRRSFHSPAGGLERIIYGKSPLRWIYLKLGGILAGGCKDRWKSNLTISNSDWTKKVMKEVYGVDSITVFPPVSSEFPEIPWDKREDGFVCLARLVPEKRIERIIEIIGRARGRGCDTHLHILGRTDNSQYARRLKKLCSRNSNWISLEGLMTGKEKLNFIANHRYSLSARDNEPFGIAVAEAVKAGCITWVPNSGGQIEIVNHSELIYDNTDDAVNKIEKVLKNSSLQIELAEHLAKQSAKFSIQAFKKEIGEIVKDFLMGNFK